MTEHSTVKQVLLDFSVLSENISDSTKWNSLKLRIVEELKNMFQPVDFINEFNDKTSFFVLLTGPSASIITLRGYANGTITLNFEFCKKDNQDDLLTYKVLNLLF